MEIPNLHNWSMSYPQAAALQRELAAKVELVDRLPDKVALVAGVDVSYQPHGELFFAGVVVLERPGWTVVEEASAVGKVKFPYVPGFLSFRELPVVIEAFRALRTRPDAVLVDGQGIAHPRRLGLASHLGLWLDLPTVGCAKSRLCGRFSSPGAAKGDRSPLMLGDEQVGVVLTTRDRVKPLFVSPGHQVDIAAAALLALQCCSRYRMPEPTRLAHHLTNQLRREYLGG